MSEFKAGDMVTWTSQAGSHSKTKTGRLLFCVPAGRSPVNCPEYQALIQAGYRKLDAPGMSRAQPSWIVVVGTRHLYWPRVHQLRLTQDVHQLSVAETDVHAVALALLQDDNGISEKAWNLLRPILLSGSAALKDLARRVDATDGRFYITQEEP